MKHDALVAVRFTPTEKKSLEEIAESRGEPVAVFVRRATLKQLAELSYLSDEQKKALEVS